MKKVIRTSVFTAFTCVLSALFLPACAGQGKHAGQPGRAKQPNIILIIADDVSQEDIGCYGNKQIRTPNIDGLAREGLRFTNMFVTASSCSPSRVSILTARYPHNTGAAELHTTVPGHLSYFPELLKEAGYYTALAGKSHLGANSNRAFDTLLTNRKAMGEGGEEQWLDLLKMRPAEKPFMFWLASYDAHRSWSADSAFSRPYRPEEVKVPPVLRDDSLTRRDLASYYNEITRLDEHIGLLKQELKRQGVLENTIIIVTADNGRPFPGSKTLLLDRGSKEPFVVYWPEGIRQAGKDVDALVSSIDIGPTLLELAGIPPAASFQGESFARLLENPRREFRNYIFMEHNWHDYEAYERAVRTRDYLYILNGRPQFENGGPIDANQSPSAASLKAHLDRLSPLQAEAFRKPRPEEEFYDNSKDPLQESNLIEDPRYQEQIAQLRNVLKQWQEETGDNLPEKLTPDWYDRETGKALPAKDQRGEMPGAARNAARINAKGPF